MRWPLLLESSGSLVELVSRTGGVDLFEGGLKFGLGGRKVLQKFGLAGKLDDKCLVRYAVGRGGEHLLQKGAAGGALIIDNFALGGADVYQQSEGQRKI